MTTGGMISVAFLGVMIALVLWNIWGHRSSGPSGPDGGAGPDHSGTGTGLGGDGGGGD